MRQEKDNLVVEITESILGNCVEISEIEKLDEGQAEFEGKDELKTQTIFLDFKQLEWVFEKYLGYKGDQ